MVWTFMTGINNKALGFRWSLPRGRILRRVLRDNPGQEYLTYIPRSGATDARILVSVHGISRNAHEQAIMFAPYCERFGIVLIVPRFTRDQHSGYQQLGQRGQGARADHVLEQCVAEVALLTGVDPSQFSLFGYSGGAQFAHRYVMAYPHRVARAAIAAAGWYTFPDHTERYPYGIRPSRKLPDVALNPESFLRVPMEVFVGENDLSTKNLRMTDRVNKQQGENRLDRARNWVSAMQIAGLSYGVEPDITLTVVPETDHSFSRFCRRGALVRRVFKSLFNVVIDPPETAEQDELDELDQRAQKLFEQHEIDLQEQEPTVVSSQSSQR
jgi:pimeloyl-ACP methyl ester carboxylesterase